MIRHRRTLLALAASLALLMLAGCVFPGAGVNVSFTSPAAGARIYSASHPASISVTGTVTGGTPDSFSFTRNGRAVTSVTLTGSTFSGTVTLDDGANALVTTATAAGFTYEATRDVYYPYLALTNGQAADLVMGQPSMTSATPGTTVQRMDGPVGAAASVGGHVYIPDTANNRVVGYTTMPAASNSPFDYVLGHADFLTKTAAPIGPSALKTPGAVAGSAGNLVVADTGNSRVLIWNGAPTINNAPAAIAVGQPGPYNTPVTTCDPSHLNRPGAAIVAGGKLIVADTSNNRVLVWNSVPSTSGAPADLVLGQADATHCNPNRGATAAANTLSSPSDVWSDGTRLVVADTGNNRVLIWDAFPTASNKAASYVIGQAGMTGSSALSADNSTGTVKTGLNAPGGVASNGNQLFIADTGYNRVVEFDAIPSSNGARANHVLGQTALSGTAPGLSASTLSSPQGVRVFDGFVIVADTGNSRELRYSAP
ncbi:MAG TPA: hypothetical protein VKB31_06650 [Trueperaceae bacterium]|nr:hypothetical protein [Trueperaceae bacterium]